MIQPRLPFLHLPAAAAVFAVIAPLVHADDRVPARDGSGILGYKSTPVLPWCGFHVHDPDRPAPPRVNPGPVPPPAPVPADAIVLFNGRDLEGWRENRWRGDAGEIVAGDGQLATVRDFGDIQLHLEWLAPADFKGAWHDRGNNGVLVHLNEEIRGETRHLGLPEYRQQRERGPLVLHGHNCPVRFRNVWVRPLDSAPAAK